MRILISQCVYSNHLTFLPDLALGRSPACHSTSRTSSVFADRTEPCDISIGQLPYPMKYLRCAYATPSPATSVPPLPRDYGGFAAVSLGPGRTTGRFLGAPIIARSIRLSPHPCYDFTARFAPPIAFTIIAKDPCYPPTLHADCPPATLHCGPARFLADLPSLLSTGASVIRQLLLAFYTCETRGPGPSSSPVSLEHTLVVRILLGREQLCSFPAALPAHC